MNLTLLVEGNPRIESFYKLNLSTWLGLETIGTNKLDDALTLLESGPRPKLIIVRAVMGKVEVAKKLINWLTLKELPIPVIVIGPGAEVPGSFAHVPNSLQIKILIQNAAKALNITAQDMSNKVVPDFFPIPIAYFRELKRAKFPDQERLLVERHAQLAAEYVTKFPHAPMGSDQIIRQHHGTMNGVGFSEHYGNNVSPVSVVFIVAEEFTRIIMKNESGSFDKAEMLRELKEEFPTSRFQKVLEKLQTLMI